MRCRHLFTIIGVTCVLLISVQHSLADVRVRGSSTILPIIKKAATLFQQKTGIKVIARGGGSTLGVSSVLQGSADIGMVSRHLQELERLQLTPYTIGQDGIAVIVNLDNPVSSLTHQQVITLFSGSMQHWSELGGENRRIVLVTKKQGRATKTLFENYFALKEYIPPTTRKIGSNAEAIMFVAGDPYSIGYVSVGTALNAKKIGIPINTVSLDGVPATIDNVATGRYPLLRPLNLVLGGEPSLEALQFVRFVQGHDGVLTRLGRLSNNMIK